MCIGYHTLNAWTILNQYTVRRVDVLNCLSGSRWFSVLGLRRGYYQIAMADQDKENTAVIWLLGFYQFERMPQGILGTPISKINGMGGRDMNLLKCLVHLDDLIVFGRTLEEHEEHCSEFWIT